VFENVYGSDDRTWAGLRSYAWVEFVRAVLFLVLVYEKQEVDWPQNWTANGSHQSRNYGHGAPGFSRVDHLLRSMQCGEALTFSSFWVICE
jgi:hypothetical protein